MGCYFEDSATGGGKRAVVVMRRKDLIYDIEQICHVEGMSMETESHHRRHMTQDVGEDGYVDRVTRVLDLAASRCRVLLEGASGAEVTKPVLTDEFREHAAYGMSVEVGSRMTQAQLVLLKNSVHEYMVCKAVSDWMSMTYPDKAAMWAAKAEDAELEIRSGIFSAQGLRIRQDPF